MIARALNTAGIAQFQTNILTEGGKKPLIRLVTDGDNIIPLDTILFRGAENRVKSSTMDLPQSLTH